MRLVLLAILFVLPLCSMAVTQNDQVSTSSKHVTKASKIKSLYHPEIGSIDMIGLKALMKSHADIVIVDTNVDEWFTGVIIPGAIRLNEDTSDEDILKTIPDKEKVIITYCGSYECPASKNFAKRLLKLGYENVLHYPGGIEEWYNKDNPVEKMPLKQRD